MINNKIDSAVSGNYINSILDEFKEEVNQDINNIESSVSGINANIANKINRTDTKTFFLEPSKWVDNKYTLDITEFGWTANTIIQINAPLPKSNIELASTISIESQNSTQVILTTSTTISEPVILTLLYGGEETTKYYVVDEIGEQTIIVQEEQVNNDIIVIANPTSSKTFENIHPNSTSFTSRNASNIYFNPGTLDFADIYVLYKYNGQTIVNIDGQGFDFAKPWILHWYITTSYGKSGTIDGIAQMVGFYSDSNANTNSIFSVNWNKSSNDGKERYGLYYNGNSKGQADAPETKNTVTNSQRKLVYDGTNITLYKMTMSNGFQPIVRSPIQFTETIKSIVFGSNSESFKDNFGLGSFILMNGTELPEIVVREDWNNKQCWSSKHIVDVEKVINVTEKVWYKNEPDGLYKWDTASNTWVKYSDPVTPPTPQTDYEKLTSGEAYKYYNVGDTVTISMYSYGDVEFDVVGKNHDGANTITLCPKNIIVTHVFDANTNDYLASDIRTYLNSNIINEFDTNIQNAIKAVEKPVHDSNGSEMSSMTDKVWLFSYTEVGFSGSSYAPVEGVRYGYFNSNSKRIKSYNGSNTRWLLRTPHTDYSSNAWYVSTNGSASYNDNVYDASGVVFGLVF